MKPKTIRKEIRSKLEEWFETIDDPKVKAMVMKNTIVTGGCIASMLLQEKVNDFDLYFTDLETTKTVAQYYVDRFKVKQKEGIPCQIIVEEKDGRVGIKIQSAGIASEDGTKKPYEYFEAKAEGEAEKYVSSIIRDPGDIEDTLEEVQEKISQDSMPDKKYRPVFMSTNAITLSNRIQLILRFYGDPAQIHENYDFVHCTNYYTSWDEQLVLNKEALACLLSKELLYVGSLYPICSIFRLRKFINRGFTVNAGQILKICMQISKLDLTNILVLQDQLTGVDCSYFMEVIGKLKEKDPEKVNHAYLIEIIDRMF